MQPGDHYAVWLCWHHETNEFVGWYVNFQLPFQRTAFGFDTFDLELDLQVRPDLSWRWKDREDFESGVALGAIPDDVAKDVEAASLEVIRVVEAREFPFDGTWIDWRPDSDWATPRLHDEWRRVAE